MRGEVTVQERSFRCSICRGIFAIRCAWLTKTPRLELVRLSIIVNFA